MDEDSPSHPLDLGHEGVQGTERSDIERNSLAERYHPNDDDRKRKLDFDRSRAYHGFTNTQRLRDIISRRSVGKTDYVVEEVDRRPPHIFISASSIHPFRTDVVNRMNETFTGIGRPSRIRRDQRGYYLFFGDSQDQLKSLRTCYNTYNQKTLLEYRMEMQMFPNGRHKSFSPKKSDRAETSSPHFRATNSGSDHMPLDVDSHTRNINPVLNTTAKPPTSPTQTTTWSLGMLNREEYGAIADRKTTPSDLSSSASLSKSRKCHICRKASPLDITSLVSCSNCRRRYHKGCHKPVISNFNSTWQCFHCSGRKRTMSPPPRPTPADFTHEIMSDLEEDVELPAGVHETHKISARPGRNEVPETPPYEGLARAATSSKSSDRRGLSTPKKLAPQQAVNRNPTKQNSHPAVAKLRYLGLVGMAFEADDQLSMSEIIAWIARTVVPFDRDLDSRDWQNGVRQALITHSRGRNAFFQIDRDDSDDPEDWLWSLSTDSAEPLLSTSADMRVLEDAPSAECNFQSATLSEGARKKRVLDLIVERGQPRFTATSLYDEHPEYRPDAERYSYEGKLEEIRERPSRKRIFGKDGVSRLKGSTPAARLRTAKLGRWRNENRAQLPRSSSDSSEETSDLPDVFESQAGEVPKREVFDSLEELLGLPNTVVPTLYDNQLAFRDGAQTQGGRLRRPQVIFRVGTEIRR